MRTILLAGLGFGDEGKGSVTDYICRTHKVHTVVRYNGAHQAAHNVVTSAGMHHTFSQFGSGTLAGALTHLSRFMLVDPLAMLREGDHLRGLGVHDAFERVTIEGDALIVTPFHAAANQAREISRELTNDPLTTGRHGSCGLGINEAVTASLSHPDTAIRVKDIGTPALREKLSLTRELMLKEVLRVNPYPLQEGKKSLNLHRTNVPLEESFIDVCLEGYQQLLNRGVRVVDSGYLPKIMTKGVLGYDTTLFEGAQGVLLDQEYGFHPHVTRSDCTFGNALKLIEGVSTDVTRLGVIRAYHTRHGSGPFPTEAPLGIPEAHNGNGPWQQAFRQGYLDFVLLRYAREVVGGVDEVALTHLDRVTGPQKVCIAYEESTKLFRKMLLSANTRGVYLMLKKMFEEEGGPYRHLFDHPDVAVYSTLSSVDRLTSGVSKAMCAPITIRSYGPMAEDKTS